MRCRDNEDVIHLCFLSVKYIRLSNYDMDSKYKRATALFQCLLQANISENSMNGAQKNVAITQVQPDMTLACPPKARNSTLKI